EASDDLMLVTTNGSFSTEETRILQGTGEATFDENGTFESNGLASVVNFVGTFTRSIGDGRTYIANGSWNGTGELTASWIELSEGFDINCDVDANDSSVTTMPVNQTVCLIDDTGDLPVYLIDGLVNANGRFTSSGETILTQEHNGASFEGIGFFEGTGIFNGTGRFVGSGHFSGEMVSPGSFYQTGIVPGEYQALVMFDDGSEVELPQTVSVGIDPSFGISLSMPGSLIAGNVTDSRGTPANNLSIFFGNVNQENASEVEIKSNETGGYYFGPLYPGTYSYRVDIDEDGYNELESQVTITNDEQLLSPIVMIPEMYDVAFQLISPVNETGVEILNLSSREVTITSNELSYTESYVTDENGMLELELLPSTYKITDLNSDEYVVFNTFTVVDDNISVNAEFSVSTTITGNLRAYSSEYMDDWSSEDKINNSVIASNLEIVVQNEEFVYSTTTDLEGNLTLVVPGDRTFQLIAYSTTFSHAVGVNLHPNNSTLLDIGIQYMNSTVVVEGTLFNYDNKTSWNNLFYNGYVPTIVATDINGFDWTVPVDNDGLFSLTLADGDYDFSVENHQLNVTKIENVTISGDVETANIELISNIEPIEINVEMCVSVNESCENGQSVLKNFTLIPTELGYSNYVVNTSSENIHEGNFRTTVNPGTYNLVITDSEEDNFTSDFNPFYQTTEIYVDFAEGNDNNYTVVFNNEWLVSGQLHYEGNSVGDKEFLAYNELDNSWRSLTTDSNGNFSDYIPVGEWILIVSPEVYDNETYTLRYPLNVEHNDQQRTNLDLELVPVMNITFNLTESLTNLSISDVRVTAVSNDGYGNVTLKASNDSGYVSDMLMPGNYSITMDLKVNDRQWIIESNQQIMLENSLDNQVDLGNLYADVKVEIGGKVYWDLNDDSIATPNEYVNDVNVTVTGLNNGITENVTTDENGIWSAFVPIRSEYNVSVTKEGYADSYFTTVNQTELVLENDSYLENTKIVASNVAVSGLITTNMVNAELQLNNSVITLHPETGSQLSAIVLAGVYENEQLTWDTQVTPGKWIVVVESPISDDNGGGIAIGYLNANVLDGGTIEMEMKSGGWLEVSTAWTDIELNNYHVGANDVEGYGKISSSPVEIVVDLEIGSTWNYSLDSDGEQRILLPVGDVIITSDFTTIQHHQGLEMDYSTTAIDSIEQGIIEMNLQYSRKVNSATKVSIIEESLRNVTYIESSLLNAVAEDEESYRNIEFDLEVEYQGTESNDLLEISGNIASSQDSEFWTIEFYNGSAWVESLNVDLGIGEAVFNASANQIDNTTIVKARVILPNLTQSISLDDGHKLSVDVTSEQGESSNVQFNVNVPQFYGLELSNVVEQTGVSPGGTGTFSMTIENSGNGDDSYVIEIADNLLEGWTITPPSTTLTISKDGQRTQQFSIFAPEDFTSGEIEATVTITSEDGLTSETEVIEIVSARISLSVDETLSQELTKVYESETGQVVVPITNSGYRTATNVLVSVDLTNDAGTEVIKSLEPLNISVPAGQTVNATFDVDPSSSKFNRFAISVEVTSDEDLEYVEDSIEPFDYQEETILDQAEGTSSWFMVVIIVLTFLVGYGGTKVARNKGTNRF
ncbi:MAG TPA: hypothetical protein HA328_05225, partial [Candidatus Poseidoniaceae archaeon]|nr:hypothetical protein [Candidatus Poseidoniaceae archaeon]